MSIIADPEQLHIHNGLKVLSEKTKKLIESE